MQIVKLWTRDTPENIFAAGGTGNWRADPDKVQQCEYVALVNPTGSTFMWGKIAGVLQLRLGTTNRVHINFSEYAIDERGGMWKHAGRGVRNPVQYQRAEDSDGLVAHIQTLTWAPFPSQRKQAIQNEEEPRVKPLTIDQAKRGIASALGVSADDIELTITLKK